MRRARKTPENFPIVDYCKLDGGFLPPDTVEGRVHEWRTDGWIIFAFADRTMDKRHGSNSAFVVECSPQEDGICVLSRALEAFPIIRDRVSRILDVKYVTSKGHPRDLRACGG